MNIPNPIKITIERGEDDKLELTVPSDLPLSDSGTGDSWEGAVRVILTWLTFSQESIEELFGRDEFEIEKELEKIKRSRLQR